MWKKWLTIGVATAVIFFLIPYSLPLIFAFLTAVMLEGAVQWIMKRFSFQRLHAVTAVFLGFVLLLAVIGYNLVSIIAHQAVSLSEKTPTFVKDMYKTGILPLMHKWEFYSKNFPLEVIAQIEQTIEKNINALDSFLQQVVAGIINLLSAIPGFMIEFLVYLIALFLFSLELPKLKLKLEAHLKEETRQKVFFVGSQLNKAGIGFLKAQVILSFVTFVMSMAGMSILGVKYTGLLSLLIVAVDILPILGTGSVLVPWAVIAILQNNHFLGIGLLILFLVITVVRRVIEPKIYSSSLGISPLASLISMYIGLKLLGIAGVFIGPIVVIIYETLRKAKVIKLNFRI
ncbi:MULTISPECIES: sporulation integral membrane protein YtvI [Mesobacillus]|uniref:Sporulation protein n=2 Tax=Mesobacillus TaxID=2675231 RepID=A0A0D6Z8J4_9BACI|nr:MULTISPECIES: sporulation integral membrane protein YtvI [Mesobacillus]KIY21862.1 sporulation protein [Mesobacillus subterraneus]MDQ0414693.1 sporulation integral membrane protein YtvI [Mesobacillus stamsii]